MIGRLCRLSLSAVLFSFMAVVGFAAPAYAVELCGKWDTTNINEKEYVAQNNVWGADTTQCIDVNGTNFRVTRSDHNNTGGTPASYPSFYKGCHWEDCTVNSGLPLQVSGIGSATSSWNVSTISSGAWNAAYDLWYKTNSTPGPPDGAELMIWLDSRGGVQPAGSVVASNVSIAGATWDVWFAQFSDWKYIAYKRTSPTSSVTNLDLRAFTMDAVSRGAIQQSWYLMGVEAGFEIWQGGTGLTTNSFSFTTGGPPSDTTPPTAPSGLTSTGKTDTSVSLSWTGSTDNVGVTAYDVYAGSTLVKTVTGAPPATSTTVTGLSPSTAYTFTVKARDAVGNTSAASNAVTVTTNSGPPPPSGGVKGQYRNFDTGSPNDNQIKPGLSVVNTGTSNLTLSTVTIRYWFTGDAGATTYSTWCDYAQKGCNNLTHRIVTLGTPRTGADRYLEVGFTSGAGSLAPGTSTGDAQLRLNKTDWSAFTESNDHSWSGTQTGYGDWTKVTVYINGTLAWGTEP